MKLPFVDTWFSQPGKSVLRMLPRRMIAPGYYENLPTAGPEFRYGIAADATGVQVCQPNGSGWAWRHTGGDALLIVQDADYTGSNVNTAQKVFDESTNGAATVAAGTTYLMEGVYYISTAGTSSHTLGLLFGGTATITTAGSLYAFTATQAATNGVIAPLQRTVQGANFATAINVNTAAAAASHHTILIHGVVRINAGGTFIPQYQWSAAPGVAGVTAGGSWFRLTPVSATTMGNWS